MYFFDEGRTMPRFILSLGEKERGHAVRRRDHVLEPVGRVVPAAREVDHLAGGRVEAFLLMTFFSGHRVVAAPLQTHEIEQLARYVLVRIRADSKLRRHDLLERHAILAHISYATEIEPIVVRKRPP